MSLKELQELLGSAKAHQQRTLEKILRDNADCEYLRKKGFPSEEKVYDKTAFKSSVPLSDYEDIEEYIQRIADDGESRFLLFSYPLLQFSISSGTTGGKPKKFPMTKESAHLHHKADTYVTSIANRLVEEFRTRDEITAEHPSVMSFRMAAKQFKTKAGYTVGPFSANFCRGESFRNNYKSLGYSSPIEVVLSEDGPQALYCHLICGLLKSSTILSIEAPFSFVLDAALNVLRLNWQRLCKDIREGVLDGEIKDEKLREAMRGVLKPDAELANAVERECFKPDWRGILKRLWPNARFIKCRCSGQTLKSYMTRINFYSDNLPIYGLTYSSSECGHMAICLALESSLHTRDIQFTLLPNVAFFEFIPIRDEENKDCQEHNNEEILTVEMDQVQIGMHYQPLVTNFQGLYRYRLSDIIKITGFEGESPTFEFVRRKNVILQVNSDKIDEVELENVIREACGYLGKHGVRMREYTTSVDLMSSPGNYVIFMEMEDFEDANSEVKDVMDECCCLLDSSFNYEYKQGRLSGKIGPLKLCLVQASTFQSLVQERLLSGTSLSQYKPPRGIPWHSKTRVSLSDSVVKVCTSSVSSWDVYSDC